MRNSGSKIVTRLIVGVAAAFIIGGLWAGVFYFTGRYWWEAGSPSAERMEPPEPLKLELPDLSQEELGAALRNHLRRGAL